MHKQHSLQQVLEVDISDFTKNKQNIKAAQNYAK